MVSKKKILLLAVLVGIFAFALVRTVSSASISASPRGDSSDYLGATKDTFSPGDNVYFNGTGFSASTTYNIYVVIDRNWTDGESLALLVRVAGTKATVTTDSQGNISIGTLLWSAPLTPGKYDVLVDVNANGKYDKGIDVLDNNDVQVSAGFFVVPEYVLGTILGLAGCFAAYGMYRLSKRQKPKLGSSTPKVLPSSK